MSKNPSRTRNNFISSYFKSKTTQHTAGFLPLIPLFANLSALGARGRGAADIAKAVNNAKAAKGMLEKSKRHNKMMETIAIGKQGSGL